MKRIFYFLFISCILHSCVTSNNIGKQGEPIFTAPLGVQAYSFRNYFPKDIPGTLDRIQAMGIREIEGEPGRLPPEEYKKMCDARKISIPSTGASFEELRDAPDDVIRKAKILGAKYVMCPWIPHERGNFTIENARNAVSVFNRAGKLFAEENITLCYHPHGYEFQPFEKGTLLDFMIENTDEKYVSYEMDIFWIYFGGGDPVKLLEKYGDRWKLMHLKDMKKGTSRDLTGGSSVENNVPLGTGELDMPAILKSAKKIGIAHYFIEDESSLVADQVPKSILYLRSLKY